MSVKSHILLTVSIIVIVALSFTLMLRAPADFSNIRFQVNEGESLTSISNRLKEENIIRSALLFRGWISFVGRDTHIGLGVYEFTAPLSLGGVVGKFMRGPDEPLLSITFPEGSTMKEIADLIHKSIPAIGVDSFMGLVRKEKLDGYLFPSTYYPLPSFTGQDMISLMSGTFEKEYGKRFSNVGFPKFVPTRNDVVSLAAILEGEAKTPTDMKIVAGILEKRLERGMRLQVDVVKATYTESGIPSLPVSNPGVIAMDAVFHPTASPYLFYLTGKDGRMYYAKTFEEHKKNIAKYLK